MSMVRLAVTVLLFQLPAVPALAADLALPEYSGTEFQALYDHAVENTLPDLDLAMERYSITGNADLDERIWERALERGYVLRPTANGDLGSVSGVRMQPPAATAWEALREEARSAGLGFVVSSAYRSPATQRTTFLSRLNGSSDSAIDSALTWYSIPGTSKHHGGYALDFRYPSGNFGGFRASPAYEWLAKDNFAVAKRHGLIPSYPDDVDNQGPNPEPWEFVWVGVGLISCGLPLDHVPPVAGPAAAITEDLARCPGGSVAGPIPDWLSTL